MRIFRFFAIVLAMTASCVGFISCSEDINTSNRYTFTGETIADFILNREDRFGSMIKIFRQAEKFGLLSTYGRYTVFVPGDSAIEAYIRKQYEIYDSTKNDPVPTWTGITSPYLEDLSDSMAVVISNSHIVPYKYEMADMKEGVLDTRNYNDRYLSVSFTTVDERFRIMINNQAGITEGDNLVENGVVHLVDAVVSPSTNSLPKVISDYPYFSIMSAALIETGIDEQLQKYVELLKGKEYPYAYESCSGGIYPLSYYAKFTAFLEPNEVFAQYGIYTLDDLKEFAQKWYGTEDVNDPTSPKNALYKFVAYHFLNRELNYNIIVHYNIDHQSYKSERVGSGMVQGLDRKEYYETFLGTMVKAVKPLSSDKAEEAQNIYLNYSHNGCINPQMLNHLNIRVIDLSTFTKMNEAYADFSSGALNGVIHPIDKILIYNEDEMKGNVLNERMRFDVATLLPELTNNGVRYARWQETGGCFHIPDGYCKNIEMYSTTTEWHYYCPYSWGTNYFGDEIIVSGQFDFAYRLPPVPAGTYELRMGYTATWARSITQFYVDGKITGIPVDLRILMDDPRIGWIDDNTTEDDGVENDKIMRSHGYMKAPSSYYATHLNDGTTARGYKGAGRIIITQQHFTGKGHWLRMKKVDEPLDRQFNHDYFELVPKSVITGVLPEDRY